MKKIAVITPIKHLSLYQKIKNDFGNNFYYFPDGMSKKYIRDSEINILFCNPNKQGYYIDSYLLSDTKINTIITASTGTNHIDLKYCQKNNIKIISLTKEIQTLEQISSTAEHAFGLMMSLIRKIPQSFDSVKNYQWNYESFLGHQLNTMNVGVIGYGRLGKMMTKYCASFDSQVYIYDPYVNVPVNWLDHNQLVGFYHYPESVDSIEILFELSDIISLHVHLTEETKYLINDILLKKLKKPKYLINTSRGEIVEESAIITALQDGRLTGYATDVLEDELKAISDSRLLKVTKENPSLNIIITPHLGGSTIEAQEIAYNKVYELYKKENERS